MSDPLQEISGTSNQPLQEMSGTSNQPVPDSGGQYIPSFNHPREDLLKGGRINYNNICVPLYQASVIGDWDTAENILDKNRALDLDLLGNSITENFDTALMIGTYSGSIKFVKNLVDRMTTQQLAHQNKSGSTALFHAALVGNVDMARAMVEKNLQLFTIRDDLNMMAIFHAALLGHHNMFAYLYDGYYKSMIHHNDWTRHDFDIHQIFWSCVNGDLFDCALKILDDHKNDIGFPREIYVNLVLYLLAQKTYAFTEIKSWKNSITWVPPAVRESSEATELLRTLWKKTLERPTDEINEILKGPLDTTKADQEKTCTIPVTFIAAEMGNIKFLVELIGGYPDLLWRKNDDEQNIFHIAVSHRHESIYNLLYEMGSSHHAMSIPDKDGNNMMHLVGMKAKSPYKDVSGTVFQMQRELLWFKEVSSRVSPYYKEMKNNIGRTPLQLFTENHKDMVSEGEKWMKETANQCMVVAALITTIVFSVAFTIPGGYDQNNGLPIFRKDGPFIAFVILDAISLILSSASILMFLSILTSRYAQEDFLISLPKKLMIGLTTLFLSIITMMVTFSISFFVLYRSKLISIPIIISVGAVVPVFMYMKLQFPLLVDAYRSTYGSRYLFRPKKPVLYYRNPRF